MFIHNFYVSLFLLVMNGEKAAYASPTFSNRRQRTLDSLITRLLQDHMHEVIYTLLHLRSLKACFTLYHLYCAPTYLAVMGANGTLRSNAR